jgi:hypothetical protein
MASRLFVYCLQELKRDIYLRPFQSLIEMVACLTFWAKPKIRYRAKIWKAIPSPLHLLVLELIFLYNFRIFLLWNL